jgi:hypothetical protein
MVCGLDRWVEDTQVIDESYDWFGTRRLGRHHRETPHPPSFTCPAPAIDRPVRGGALQALTRDALIRRSLDISSTSFTTIVSIIQGVTLAILAERTFKNPSPLVFSQSLAMLLVLVCVFYTYVTMSIMLRWAPSFMDSFLPFAIASLEIPPAYFLGNVAAWNTWLAALWIGGSAGLFITIKWSPPSHFGKEVEAHLLLHRMLRELALVSAAGGVTMGILGLLAQLFPVGRPWWGAAGVGTVLAVVGMLVARTELRSSQIHERFGVNRPPFN